MRSVGTAAGTAGVHENPSLPRVNDVDCGPSDKSSRYIVLSCFLLPRHSVTQSFKGPTVTSRDFLRLFVTANCLKSNVISTVVPSRCTRLLLSVRLCWRSAPQAVSSAASLPHQRLDHLIFLLCDLIFKSSRLHERCCMASLPSVLRWQHAGHCSSCAVDQAGPQEEQDIQRR